MATDINNMVFLGLNSSVAALDSNTGDNRLVFDPRLVEITLLDVCLADPVLATGSPFARGILLNRLVIFRYRLVI